MTWHVPRNLSAAPKYVPRRRLLQAKHRHCEKWATGAFASRFSQASSTAYTIRSGPKTNNAVVKKTFLYTSSPPNEMNGHQPGHDLAETLDRCIPVAAANVEL